MKALVVLSAFVVTPLLAMLAYRLCSDYWKARCSRCMLDADMKWVQGAANGAVSTVLMLHTCSRWWRALHD